MSIGVRELERRILSNPLRPLVLRAAGSKPGIKARRKKGRRDDEPDDKDKKAPPPEDVEEDDDEPEEKEEPKEEEKEDDEDDKEEKKRDDKSPGTVEGYAAVFHDESDPGTEYKLWDDRDFTATERIAQGAFSRALAEQDDCRALYNHNSDHVLGRSTAGTLRMEEDAKGLRYEADLPDTQMARDLAASITRGDINGSSFGFVVESESWEEDKDADGRIRATRTIRSVRLLDVGPVTYPAYASATSGARSALGSQRALGTVEEARASYQRWKESGAASEAATLDGRLARIRARAVEAECGAAS